MPKMFVFLTSLHYEKYVRVAIDCSPNKTFSEIEQINLADFISNYTCAYIKQNFNL